MGFADDADIAVFPSLSEAIDRHDMTAACDWFMIIKDKIVDATRHIDLS